MKILNRFRRLFDGTSTTSEKTASVQLADGSWADATVALPFTAAAKITPGTPVEPGLAVWVDCTTAGRIRFVLSSGSTLEASFETGPSLIKDLAVKDVVIVSGAADVSVLS